MKVHQPRTNEMSDVSNFLGAWEDADSRKNHEQVDLHLTSYGNVNSTGEVGNYDGHALTPWHPQFEDSIEAGVRELVLECVKNLQWVTYTSCEGHQYDGLLQLHPVERHVGILPRSPIEYQEVYETLQRLQQLVHQRYWQFPVRVETIELNLESRGTTYRVLDLFFRKHPQAPWWLYFRLLPLYYRQVLAGLRTTQSK
jgi:uncharacterized protein